MKGNEVRELVQGVPVGTTLKLVYKMDSPKEFMSLIGMMNYGIVEDEPEVREHVSKIGISGKWGTGQNPNHISLKTTKLFNVEWFVNRVSYSLESLTVEKPAPETASLINGPEEATYSAQANLLSAGDPTCSIGVSVTIGETNNYVDFWIRDFGTWRRVLELQRVIKGMVKEKEAYLLLMAQVKHAIDHPEIGPIFSSDMRLTLGLSTLQSEISAKL